MTTRSVATASAFMLAFAGLVLPWALMGGGVVLLAGWVRRRLAKAGASASRT